MAPVETELYDLLGVPVDASQEDIKKAYKRRAIAEHPDKNPNDPDASQRFQEMVAAYDVLKDPETRAIYDERGLSGLGGGPTGGGPGMEDLFAQFFGGGGPGFEFDFMGGAPRRTKGQDEVIPYEVTLEDLYNGKHVKMDMERQVECNSCHGSGGKGKAKPKKCVSCDGRGWSISQAPIGPNMYGTSRVRCVECHGKGEKIRAKDACKKCKGVGTVKEKKRQEIFVEKGMTDRQRIVLAGAGDQEPGLPPGDVIFALKVHKHAKFERSGNDLLTNVKITLSEALFGFSRILLTHLDGRGIKVTSPPGKIIKPESSIVLRGEGMPKPKIPDQKGDLYVVFEIEMPDAQWLNTVDVKALQALLPPQAAASDPVPEIVDESKYEESDILDVRARSFAAGSNFFDDGFAHQFGGADDDWEDEDEEDEMHGGEPECTTQ